MDSRFQGILFLELILAPIFSYSQFACSLFMPVYTIVENKGKRKEGEPFGLRKRQTLKSFDLAITNAFGDVP